MKNKFPQGIWPVDFPEANMTLTSPPGMEDRVHPMRFCRSGANWTGCWYVSWRMRIAILLRGRIYSNQVSEGNAQPMALVARHEDLFIPDRPMPFLDAVLCELRPWRRLRGGVWQRYWIGSPVEGHTWARGVVDLPSGFFHKLVDQEDYR